MISSDQSRSTCIICGRKRLRSDMIPIRGHWYCKLSRYHYYDRCKISATATINKMLADYLNLEDVFIDIRFNLGDKPDIIKVLPPLKPIEIPISVQPNGLQDLVVSPGLTKSAGRKKKSTVLESTSVKSKKVDKPGASKGDGQKSTENLGRRSGNVRRVVQSSRKKKNRRNSL